MKHMKPLNGLIAAALLLLAACAAAEPKGETPKERLAKAEALFAARCKTAGEKIHRTVDNVEGIYLMKLRPKGINYGKQFEMDDPYGSDFGGDGYIENFVRGQFQATHKGTPAPGSPPRLGYPYVDALDPADGKRYRYTGRIEEPWKRDSRYGKWVKQFVLDKTPAPDPAPCYGVTYDDLSTREDRDYWIAGSSLRVIDLQTNDVIAERIGYMMDREQGNNSGGRAPWLQAADHACPAFHRNPKIPLIGPAAAAQSYQTLDFVEKVLHPVQEK